MKEKRLVTTAILDDDAFNALPEAVQNLGFRIERIVDDFGLFRADARFLKLKAAAYNKKITEKAIPDMIKALEKVNFIQLYTVDGKLYGLLVSNVNRHRTKPTYPLPDGYSVEKQKVKDANDRYVIAKKKVGDNPSPTCRQVGDNVSPNKGMNENHSFSTEKEMISSSACACAGGCVGAPPQHASRPQEEEVTDEEIAAMDKELKEDFDNDPDCK